MMTFQQALMDSSAATNSDHQAAYQLWSALRTNGRIGQKCHKCFDDRVLVAQTYSDRLEEMYHFECINPTCQMFDFSCLEDYVAEEDYLPTLIAGLCKSDNLSHLDTDYEDPDDVFQHNSKLCKEIATYIIICEYWLNSVGIPEPMLAPIHDDSYHKTYLLWKHKDKFLKQAKSKFKCVGCEHYQYMMTGPNEEGVCLNPECVGNILDMLAWRFKNHSIELIQQTIERK